MRLVQQTVLTRAGRGKVKERIQGCSGHHPLTWAAVGGCWAGDCKAKLGRLDWHSQAGWMRRVEGEPRAGSRQEISTVVLRGGMEALSSETDRGAGKEAQESLQGKGPWEQTEGLYGNCRVCLWETGLVGLRVELQSFPQAPGVIEEGGETVKRWGQGCTSPSDAFSLCVSAESGMGSDTKINNLLTWHRPENDADSDCESAPGSGPGQTFPSQRKGTSQPLFWKFPLTLSLF